MDADRIMKGQKRTPLLVAGRGVRVFFFDIALLSPTSFAPPEVPRGLRGWGDPEASHWLRRFSRGGCTVSDRPHPGDAALPAFGSLYAGHPCRRVADADPLASVVASWLWGAGAQVLVLWEYVSARPDDQPLRVQVRDLAHLGLRQRLRLAPTHRHPRQVVNTDGPQPRTSATARTDQMRLNIAPPPREGHVPFLPASPTVLERSGGAYGGGVCSDDGRV